MPFLKGVAAGFVLMFMLGPSFFYLIKVAILQGFKKAIGFALGILLSDLFMIVPIFFGLRKVFESDDFQIAFALIASVAMIFLGIKYLTKKKETTLDLTQTEEQVKNGVAGYIVKGFSLNIINPFTIMLWLSLPSFVNLGTNTIEIALFVSGLAITIMCLDFSKAFLANKLAAILNEKILLLIDKILGIVLLCFSVRFIVLTIQNFDVILKWFHVS